MSQCSSLFINVKDNPRPLSQTPQTNCEVQSELN